MTTRYAIYYVPGTETALYRFGARWLSNSTYQTETSVPAHYGFHATLKAPFVLNRGFTEGMLDEAMCQFVARLEPFDIPALSVARFNQTLSLVPNHSCVELDRLAFDCVQRLDTFRGPLTAQDYNKRPDSELTPRQQQLRKRWGYPHVLDEFRFHMTLTNSLSDETRKEQLFQELSKQFQCLQHQPHSVDSLCVFRQPNRQAPFTAFRRYHFETAAEIVS